MQILNKILQSYPIATGAFIQLSGEASIWMMHRQKNLWNHDQREHTTTTGIILYMRLPMREDVTI